MNIWFYPLPLCWSFFLFLPLIAWSNLQPKSCQPVAMPPSLSECNKITPTAHRTFGWIIEFTLVGHFFTKSQLRTFRHNALRLAHEMRHNSQIQALEWVSHHLLAPFIDQAELLINTMWCVMCWIVKKRELRLRSLGRKTTRLSPHTYIA